MFILFFIMWIIFNGKITWEIVLFGLAVSLAMYCFICRFMNYSPKKDIKLLKNIFCILEYIITLLMEIFKANFSVIALVLSSKEEPEPRIVTFRTDIHSDFLKVVLANTITLTPGTITACLEEDIFTVHCLDKAFAEGMTDSIFVRLLKQMEETL